MRAMARPKLKFTWIADQKARKTASRKRMIALMKKAHELTILCNISACMIFFNRDENMLVVWPSQEVAKSLIDRFYSLPEMVRNMKAENQESYIMANIKKIEKKIADTRKVIAELEMDHLMFQLENGRPLGDLSQTELENLISYVNKKMKDLERRLGYAENSHTNVKEPFVREDQTPMASGVASETGPCFSQMGSGTVYLMDKWFFFNHCDGTHSTAKVPRFDLNLLPSDDDDPKYKKHCDGTPSTTNVSRFDLNLPPSDDDEDMVMTTNEKGESSKSGGADDA